MDKLVTKISKRKIILQIENLSVFFIGHYWFQYSFKVKLTVCVAEKYSVNHLRCLCGFRQD